MHTPTLTRTTIGFYATLSSMLLLVLGLIWFLNVHPFYGMIADETYPQAIAQSDTPLLSLEAARTLLTVCAVLVPALLCLLTYVRFARMKEQMMEHTRLTQQLQESLRLSQAANKSKNDFLANMSHELRTPMNGVLGMAQLLADTPLNEEQHEYVNTINGSGETLLMLLNDILDFSKIEAGALELESIAFGLPEMIEETVSLMRPQAMKKTIGLSFEADEAVPQFVWGDSGRLRQIITNLVGNAIKFTEHGFVKITAMPLPANPSIIRITVEDTGMGIHASKLAAIFEKFTQADNSVTRKYGGTGLGLAISKQLIEMMGGAIGVESQEGHGSTFWCEIPLPEACAVDCIVMGKTERIHKENRVLIDAAAARVLLVEDYPTNQWFAKKLLQKFGFRHIDLAMNGMEALAAWQSNHYDAIFMDCQMPEMDGYAATEEIRQMETMTGDHVPIIAMTANAMVGDREKCMHVGMDDYVSKPLRTRHLTAVLSAWFRLSEPEAETVAANAAVTPAAVVDTDSPVLIDQLNQFTNGDAEEEKNLVALYDEQATMILSCLEQSLESNDSEEWRSAAHRLKGASANLGATTLQALCAKAEAAPQADANAKGAMLSAIHTELARITSFFQARAMVAAS